MRIEIAEPCLKHHVNGQGDFEGEMLNEVEIIDLKDDGERSVDDKVANFARGIANAFITTGTAIGMPFVALAKNKNIDWAAGDKYTSANPYALQEDTGMGQLDGSKQEVGKEVMKATVGAIFSFVPINLPWLGEFGVQAAASEGVNKAIDSLPDD